MIHEVTSYTIKCDICCDIKSEKNIMLDSKLSYFNWERIGSHDLCFKCYGKLLNNILNDISKDKIEEKIMNLKDCDYKDKFPSLDFYELVENITAINEKCNAEK